MPEHETIEDSPLIPLPVQAIFCLLLLGTAAIIATALIIVAASQMNALHVTDLQPGKLGESTWTHVPTTPRPTPTANYLPTPVTR